MSRGIRAGAPCFIISATRHFSIVLNLRIFFQIKCAHADPEEDVDEADTGSYTTNDTDSSDSDSSDSESDSSEEEEQAENCGKENKNAASAPTPDEGSTKESAVDDNDLMDPPDCWPDKLRNKFACLNPNVEKGTCLLMFNARKTSYRIIEHSWFETFIVLMIMASSCALAFEDVKLRDRPRLQRALKYSDKIFTYVFICEMFLKWMGYGFKKYFTNAWCWLDFAIVSVSLHKRGLFLDAIIPLAVS